MRVFDSTADMKRWAWEHRLEGKSIGLVPTMGYLHEGHISLVRRARAENDLVVVSLFVNPTQFGPGEDLERYPRDPEGDERKCAEAGANVLYMPTAAQLYPPGFQTYVEVDKVSRPLCGASRPGHFRGVATIVLKLFSIVQPSAAYFGRKDHQQLQVITTMVRDLDLNIRIVPCETIREKDGLAMSSRNAYLASHERRQAVCLYQALLEARRLFNDGERSAERYLRAMRERVEQEPDARIDYVSLVDPETLEDLQEVQDRAVAALAVKIGSTRLIDNMLLEGRT
ncbi:MAG: pantoate--beta-alanine ligase [Desulfomonile sp.]|nr:pantoate--beta-alanine ligase [Desulfomonile sp.]